MVLKNRILDAKAHDYNITLLFFWLINPELAKERVKTRVLEGGHDIPESVIERRYHRGIKNLFEMYISIVDQVLIFDNSEGKPNLIAEISHQDRFSIHHEVKFNELKKYL